MLRFKSKPRCTFAFFDSFFGSYVAAGKIIFFKNLKKMLTGNVIFKMEENKSFELIIKSHFQGSVSSRLQWRHSDHGSLNWPVQLVKRRCSYFFLTIDCVGHFVTSLNH
jgi:hypothetical protein